MVRSVSLCLLLLAGCPRTVTLTPVIEVPPRVPFLIAAEVRKALQQANDADADAPAWRILGGHEAAGYLVEHYRLGRGLHLILAIDQDARAFTHQIWFDARNLDPAAGSALLELYRDRPGSDRVRAYEMAGARISAGISRELGFFSATAPAKLGDVQPFEKIAKLESERLSKQLDPKGALARAASLTDPRERVEQVMSRALLATREASARPALDEDSLKEIAQATLAPQRLVLAVVGSVDRTRVLTVLRQAHEERGSAAEIDDGPAKQRASAPAFPVEVSIPADDREFLMGWTIDPVKHGLALEVAAYVLAGGEPSRLSSRLGDGVAGIRARAPEGSRTLEVSLILEPTITTTKAAERVKEQIEAIARGDPIKKELDRARVRMTREVLAKASGLESRAELFAAALLMGGSIDAIDLRIAELSELSEETVRTAVKEGLSGRAPAMVLGAPDKDGS